MGILHAIAEISQEKKIHITEIWIQKCKGKDLINEFLTPFKWLIWLTNSQVKNSVSVKHSTSEIKR